MAELKRYMDVFERVLECLSGSASTPGCIITGRPRVKRAKYYLMVTCQKL